MFLFLARTANKFVHVLLTVLSTVAFLAFVAIYYLRLV
jgi:hypothetical protein